MDAVAAWRRWQGKSRGVGAEALAASVAASALMLRGLERAGQSTSSLLTKAKVLGSLDTYSPTNVKQKAGKMRSRAVSMTQAAASSTVSTSKLITSTSGEAVGKAASLTRSATVMVASTGGEAVNKAAGFVRSSSMKVPSTSGEALKAGSQSKTKAGLGSKLSGAGKRVASAFQRTKSKKASNAPSDATDATGLGVTDEEVL